jgi:SagB-type dehydrogenase family enzyme
MRTAALAAAGAAATACAATAQVGEEAADLPAPDVAGTGSLEEALAKRRSVRRFTADALTPEEISQLLWSMQGITRDWGARTAPSAGALYPLEVYVATAEGLYHYVPQGHRTVLAPKLGLRQELWAAGLKQDWIREAPAVFVIAAVYARTAAKYGDRAKRYVHLEAGHVAENLLLQAVALGLGGVPVGAFHDDKVQDALGLPEDQEPLYLIPVGHPDE